MNATSDNGQALTYAYDAVGNRLNVQGAPELPTTPISTTYQYNAIHAMLRAGNATLDYDDNGNRVRSEQPLADTKYAELGLSGTLVTDYTFDIEDRLVAVRERIYYGKTRPGGTRTTDPGAVVMEADYSYDGDGRRFAKLVQTYNLQGAPRCIAARICLRWPGRGDRIDVVPNEELLTLDYTTLQFTYIGGKFYQMVIYFREYADLDHQLTCPTRLVWLGIRC